MDNYIKLDKDALRLPRGSKWRGGNRCTSVNLTQETKDAIDELVPSKYRSAWIERWCRLGLAIQSWEGIDEWAEWFVEAGGGMRGWTAFGRLSDRIGKDTALAKVLLHE
ncbi:MAG: hypothetical protein KAJ19_17325 [Gammaproteobacteria bacterium]|nr:hypothetical protein [Gammaproteobacteria bacterium]